MKKIIEDSDNYKRAVFEIGPSSIHLTTATLGNIVYGVEMMDISKLDAIHLAESILEAYSGQ